MKWNSWMLGLLASAVMTSSAFAGISCTGYVAAPIWNGAYQTQWAGYYTATMNNGRAQVTLNGTSFSLDNCFPYGQGQQCRESNVPAYVLTQGSFGPALTLAVDTGATGTVNLGVLSACNYF